jgi:putative FmdB family regulatory protein
MPFYDFKCDKCEKIVEEFFKIADDKYIECCGIQMKQVILKAPGLSDPAGVGQKWTNDGYQMKDGDAGHRIVKEKWEKGKNVIRGDVHSDDPGPGTAQKRDHKSMAKKLKENQDAGIVGRMSDHCGILKKTGIQP